jgi:hypothetical protein
VGGVPFVNKNHEQKRPREKRGAFRGGDPLRDGVPPRLYSLTYQMGFAKEEGGAGGGNLRQGVSFVDGHQQRLHVSR